MDPSSSIELDKAAFRDNVVRVTIPANIAYDLDKMRRVTESVLDQLGCSACHSGHDIRFDIERRFIVDNKLQVFNQAELLHR